MSAIVQIRLLIFVYFYFTTLLTKIDRFDGEFDRVFEVCELCGFSFFHLTICILWKKNFFFWKKLKSFKRVKRGYLCPISEFFPSIFFLRNAPDDHDDKVYGIEATENRFSSKQ